MDATIPRMRKDWERYYTTEFRNDAGDVVESRVDRLQGVLARILDTATNLVSLESVMRRMETNKLLFGEYWVTPDTLDAALLSPRQRDKINLVRRSKGGEYARILRRMYAGIT